MKTVSPGYLILSLVVFTMLFLVSPRNEYEIILLLIFTTFILPSLMGWSNPLLIYLRDADDQPLALKLLLISLILVSVWKCKIKELKKNLSSK